MSGGGRFREFEHTADLGIEVEAESQVGLFETAGMALFSLMVDRSGVAGGLQKSVVAVGEGIEDLLHAWLQQLLLAFALDGFVASAVKVTEVGEDTVTGTITGELFDERKHRFKREIKGVTYHGLEVRERGGKWRARIIVDV